MPLSKLSEKVLYFHMGDIIKAAINALGNLRDVRAVDPLINLLQQSPWGHDAIIDALIMIGNSAVEALGILLLNETPRINQAAGLALEKIGSPEARRILAARTNVN